MFSPNSKAASFDCTKASTNVERKICGSEHLSALDVEMAQTYIKARKLESAIRYDQREWLHNTRNRCATEYCLSSVYEERIYELRQKISGTTQEPGSRQLSSDSRVATQDYQANKVSKSKRTPTIGGFGLGDIGSCLCEECST